MHPVGSERPPKEWSEIGRTDAEPTPPVSGRTACRVGPFAELLRCDNPGLMELDGTNTWILAAPDSRTCVVVDPGPDHHYRHLGAVAAGRNVALVLVTHGHPDHVGGLDDFVALCGAPVRAFDPQHCRDEVPLRAEEAIHSAGLQITVKHTPGHTEDSVSFLVEHAQDRAILTGDTVLGSGSTLLEDRSDALKTYLASLDLLSSLGPARLFPGHGPEHPDQLPVVEWCRSHRLQRLAGIRAYLIDHGITAADAEPRAVAERLYVDTHPDLLEMATASVRSQLAYLIDAEAATTAA